MAPHTADAVVSMAAHAFAAASLILLQFLIAVMTRMPIGPVMAMRIALAPLLEGADEPVPDGARRRLLIAFQTPMTMLRKVSFFFHRMTTTATSAAIGGDHEPDRVGRQGGVEEPLSGGARLGRDRVCDRRGGGGDLRGRLGDP